LNISYVEAPHQLLEAIEYSSLVMAGSNTCYLIRDNGNADQKNQFNAILQDEQISSFHYIAIPKAGVIKKLFGAIWLGFIVLRFRSAKYFLVGDLRSFVSKLVMIVSGVYGKQLVVVDDGLYLLGFYEGIKTRNLIIYTCLPLKVNADLGHQIIKKQRAKIPVSAGAETAIVFIGMKLVELDFVEHKEYIDVLRLVKSRHDDAVRYLYYAHREELGSKLDAIAEIGYTVLSPEVPLEKHFEAHGAPKGYYYSYYSTALYNLSASVDSEAFYCIKPRETEWPESYRDAIVECYKLLSISHVQEVHV